MLLMAGLCCLASNYPFVPFSPGNRYFSRNFWRCHVVLGISAASRTRSGSHLFRFWRILLMNFRKFSLMSAMLAQLVLALAVPVTAQEVNEPTPTYPTNTVTV